MFAHALPYCSRTDCLSEDPSVQSRAKPIDDCFYLQIAPLSTFLSFRLDRKYDNKEKQSIILSKMIKLLHDGSLRAGRTEFRVAILG
jgi:hypothetical protein